MTYPFNSFDKNNNGRITFNSIKGYFIDDKIDETVFRNIYDEIDTNKDGEIDYTEFINMILGD